MNNRSKDNKKKTKKISLSEQLKTHLENYDIIQFQICCIEKIKNQSSIDAISKLYVEIENQLLNKCNALDNLNTWKCLKIFAEETFKHCCLNEIPIPESYLNKIVTAYMNFAAELLLSVHKEDACQVFRQLICYVKAQNKIFHDKNKKEGYNLTYLYHIITMELKNNIEKNLLKKYKITTRSEYFILASSLLTLILDDTEEMEVIKRIENGILYEALSYLKQIFSLEYSTSRENLLIDSIKVRTQVGIDHQMIGNNLEQFTIKYDKYKFTQNDIYCATAGKNNNDKNVIEVIRKDVAGKTIDLYRDKKFNEIYKINLFFSFVPDVFNGMTSPHIVSEKVNQVLMKPKELDQSLDSNDLGKIAKTNLEKWLNHTHIACIKDRESNHAHIRFCKSFTSFKDINFDEEKNCNDYMDYVSDILLTALFEKDIYAFSFIINNCFTDDIMNKISVFHPMDDEMSLYQIFLKTNDLLTGKEDSSPEKFSTLSDKYLTKGILFAAFTLKERSFYEKVANSDLDQDPTLLSAELFKYIDDLYLRLHSEKEINKNMIELYTIHAIDMIAHYVVGAIYKMNKITDLNLDNYEEKMKAHQEKMKLIKKEYDQLNTMMKKFEKIHEQYNHPYLYAKVLLSNLNAESFMLILPDMKQKNTHNSINNFSDLFSNTTSKNNKNKKTNKKKKQPEISNKNNKDKSTPSIETIENKKSHKSNATPGKNQNNKKTESQEKLNDKSLMQVVVKDKPKHKNEATLIKKTMPEQNKKPPKKDHSVKNNFTKVSKIQSNQNAQTTTKKELSLIETEKTNNEPKKSKQNDTNNKVNIEPSHVPGKITEFIINENKANDKLMEGTSEINLKESNKVHTKEYLKQDQQSLIIEDNEGIKNDFNKNIISHNMFSKPKPNTIFSLKESSNDIYERIDGPNNSHTQNEFQIHEQFPLPVSLSKIKKKYLHVIHEVIDPPKYIIGLIFFFKQFGIDLPVFGGFNRDSIGDNKAKDTDFVFFIDEENIRDKLFLFLKNKLNQKNPGKDIIFSYDSYTYTIRLSGYYDFLMTIRATDNKNNQQESIDISFLSLNDKYAVNDFTCNESVSFLEGNKLIIRVSDPVFEKHIRQKQLVSINKYEKINPEKILKPLENLRALKFILLKKYSDGCEYATDLAVALSKYSNDQYQIWKKGCLEISKNQNYLRSFFENCDIFTVVKNINDFSMLHVFFPHYNTNPNIENLKTIQFDDFNSKVVHFCLQAKYPLQLFNDCCDVLNLSVDEQNLIHTRIQNLIKEQSQFLMFFPPNKYPDNDNNPPRKLNPNSNSYQPFNY